MQVQHAGLKDSCTADILTVECLVRLVDWFFPDFNYTWLVEEIKNTTPKVCGRVFRWLGLMWPRCIQHEYDDVP